MTISISSKLQTLQLSYPFYLFDLDQSPWPRKLSSILPGSRPAKLSGFLPWGWEYGTTLYRIDDPIPENVVDTRKREWDRLGDVTRILKTLRYDDRFSEETFEVVFEGGGKDQAGVEMERRDFRDWWSRGDGGFVDGRRVVRIVRKWDGVPFWDREDCWNLLDDGHAEKYRVFGVATLVRDEKELIAAAGVRDTTKGDEIRKAEIELLDGEGEAVKGVIFPERWQNNDHGLSLRGGPNSVWNRELLMGTALEGAPWSEVEDYIHGRRQGPLWLEQPGSE